MTCHHIKLCAGARYYPLVGNSLHFLRAVGSPRCNFDNPNIWRIPDIRTHFGRLPDRTYDLGEYPMEDVNKSTPKTREREKRRSNPEPERTRERFRLLKDSDRKRPSVLVAYSKHAFVPENL